MDKKEEREIKPEIKRLEREEPRNGKETEIVQLWRRRKRKREWKQKNNRNTDGNWWVFCCVFLGFLASGFGLKAKQKKKATKKSGNDREAYTDAELTTLSLYSEFLTLSQRKWEESERKSSLLFLLLFFSPLHSQVYPPSI